MRGELVHRGPDSDGEYVDCHAALGIRRLRVIDLVTGEQPQCGEQQRMWTIFNGEIYNFAELREQLVRDGHQLTTHSDTEVIVHLYEAYGPRCVARLDGMFALAVWDSSERTLFLARDRLGKKPLLYLARGDEFYFASEHQSLRAGVPRIALAADADSIALYLRLGYVPAPLDAFRDVRKLEPAHWLLWRDGEVTTRCYWRPRAGTLPIADQDAVTEVRRLFDQAVKKRLVADVPVGAFLSGGVDSSALVASMSAQTAIVRTFTIGFEETDYNEVLHARRVATHFGTDHHEFVVRPRMLDTVPLLVRHFGEPYADSSAIPTYYLSQLTRQSVTVALAGDGGDELFAGYQRYHAVQLGSMLDRVPFRLHAPVLALADLALSGAHSERSIVGRTHRFVRGVRQLGPERYLKWLTINDAQWLASSATEEFAPAVERAALILRARANAVSGDAVARARRLDVELYLPDDLLVKVDITSMANSLEVRSPFLDHTLVEFALQLPTSLLIRGTQRKWVLREALRGILPRETLARRKQGFALPIGKWLRGDLRTMLHEIVLSQRALQRGLLRPDAVRRLVDEHIAGIDHTHRLWALVMLELWHREFIDG